MGLYVSNTAIWEEIERSESYLVCCMFEEAASLASSVLRRLCETISTETVEDAQLNDMMESAGMVLVQSLKEIGRITMQTYKREKVGTSSLEANQRMDRIESLLARMSEVLQQQMQNASAPLTIQPTPQLASEVPRSMYAIDVPNTLCNSMCPIPSKFRSIESANCNLADAVDGMSVRTSEIPSELKILFGSVSTIPVQVLLTGACFQISEGSTSGLQEILEEFLSKWKYVDGRSYILANADARGAYIDGCDGHYVLGVERYLEVVELYTVTLLGMVSNDIDLAISWAEKAELPEERRKELLRRLHSLYSLKATNSSQGALLADKNEAHSASGNQSIISGVEGSSRASKAQYPPNGGNDTQKTILKFSQWINPFSWWFRTITLNLANTRLIISHGKIVLLCPLIFFIYHVFWKKRATLTRSATRHAFSVKKALVDMWQLAFSVQVNPLAAIQPLPVATHGSRCWMVWDNNSVRTFKVITASTPQWSNIGSTWILVGVYYR
ncbi:hypothetical protein HHK36_013457 [Tetracentron sinense]|uniref:Uncharacterized protein n=1 Tax=Tetracentron sinense TaxID=13715 RepID=A0A834ZAB0_TETSI|nr:hypothetical protein HHK36_013457 [Tetracentron sinense]